MLSALPTCPSVPYGRIATLLCDLGKQSLSCMQLMSLTPGTGNSYQITNGKLFFFVRKCISAADTGTLFLTISHSKSIPSALHSMLETPTHHGRAPLISLTVRGDGPWNLHLPKIRSVDYRPFVPSLERPAPARFPRRLPISKPPSSRRDGNINMGRKGRGRFDHLAVEKEHHEVITAGLELMRWVAEEASPKDDGQTTPPCFSGSLIHKGEFQAMCSVSTTTNDTNNGERRDGVGYDPNIDDIGISHGMARYTITSVLYFSNLRLLNPRLNFPQPPPAHLPDPVDIFNYVIT